MSNSSCICLKKLLSQLNKQSVEMKLGIKILTHSTFYLKHALFYIFLNTIYAHLIYAWLISQIAIKNHICLIFVHP